MKALSITHAFLQVPLQIPNGRGVFSQLTLAKPKGIKMEYVDGALFCDYGGYEFMVPESNIVGLIIDKSEDVVKTKK